MIKRHREILSSSIIMLSLHLALGLFAASFAVSAQTCFPTAPSEPVIIHASPATGWFLDESPTEYIGIILFSATIANLMNITLLDATANTYQIQPYDATATTQCIYGRVQTMARFSVLPVELMAHNGSSPARFATPQVEVLHASLNQSLQLHCGMRRSVFIRLRRIWDVGCRFRHVGTMFLHSTIIF
ncbi:hypothetical protein BT96DRAFT_928961, partial [Gymnopus androsaceus JB14]